MNLLNTGIDLFEKLQKREQYAFFVYLLLVIIGLFAVKPLGFVAVLALPAYILISPKHKNLLLELPHIVLINIGLLIIQGTLLDLLSIKITYNSILLFSLLTALAILFYKAQFNKKENEKTLQKKDLRALYFIYGLFMLAFIARVLSVISFNAPILHDPFSHAEWSQMIVQEGAINYFYSPGLHILTAFTQMAGVAFVAKGILVYSNLFSAFAVLSWGVYALKAADKKHFPGLLAFLVFVAPILPILNLNAGKNALILSVAFIPLAFHALKGYVDSNALDISKLFLSIFALAVIGLVHYPSFGYILAVFGVGIFFKLLGLIKKSKPLHNFIFRSFFLFIGVVATAGLWILLAFNSFDDPGEVMNKTRSSSALHLNLAGFENVYNFFKSTFSKFSRPRLTGIFLNLGLFTAILGVFHLKRKDATLYAGAFLVPLTVLSLSFTLHFLNHFNIGSIPGIGVLADTGYLFSGVLFTIPIALFVADFFENVVIAKWQKIVFWIILLLFLIIFTGLQGYRYRTRWVNLNPVAQSDIEAFEWINESIDNNEGFIIDSFQFGGGRKPNVVFAGLSGLWIPTYTDNPVTANFQDFNLKTVHENHQLYQQIKNNQATHKSLKRLNEKGFFYYYYDKGPFAKPLNMKVLTRNENIKTTLIYQNDEVSIYEMVAL